MTRKTIRAALFTALLLAGCAQLATSISQQEAIAIALMQCNSGHLQALVEPRRIRAELVHDPNAAGQGATWLGHMEGTWISVGGPILAEGGPPPEHQRFHYCTAKIDATSGAFMSVSASEERPQWANPS